MHTSDLDHIFGALADPTRRGILERLAQGPANIRTLAAPFKVSQPAISRHVRVLEGAGLIRRRKRGRDHYISVKTEAVDGARGWITHYTRFWKKQFDAR